MGCHNDKRFTFVWLPDVLVWLKFGLSLSAYCFARFIINEYFQMSEPAGSSSFVIGKC